MDVNSKLADAYYGYSNQDDLEAAFDHWISFKKDEELIEYADDFDLDIWDNDCNLKDDWFETLADFWIEKEAADYDGWED